MTGPTSSGKTTTLYATLNELNEINDKIITTEEPVEYEIEGLVQIPVNPDIGVTFATCLRAILRQDPDKILVGETRDLETAEIAIQASPDRPHRVHHPAHERRPVGRHAAPRHGGADVPHHGHGRGRAGPAARAEDLPELQDRVHPQRRGRDGAGHDRTRRPQQKKFYYGRGCERCNNTGYKGRQGIFELIVMNDKLREMVVAEASLDEFREACRKSGMQTLRESGLQAIHDGPDLDRGSHPRDHAGRRVSRSSVVSYQSSRDTDTWRSPPRPTTDN